MRRTPPGDEAGREAVRAQQDTDRGVGESMAEPGHDVGGVGRQQFGAGREQPGQDAGQGGGDLSVGVAEQVSDDERPVSGARDQGNQHRGRSTALGAPDEGCRRRGKVGMLCADDSLGLAVGHEFGGPASSQI